MLSMCFFEQFKVYMLLRNVFTNIKNLQVVCSPLTSAVVQRCEDAQIRTVLDFVLFDLENLAKKIDTPYKDVAAIHNFLLAEYSAFPQRGDSIYDLKLQTVTIVQTGSEKLDSFLSGGIYTGEVTEIHGTSGAGKTQLCFSVAANALLEHASVIYLDTNGSFSANRMNQILLHKLGLDANTPFQSVAEEKLKNLEVVPVYDIYQFFDALFEIEKNLNNQSTPFYQHLKLVIIDSVTHLLSPCLASSRLDGHCLIMSAAQKLKSLAQRNNQAVIICNNMVRGDGFSLKPALGNNWKYVPSVTVCITKSNEKQNEQKMCRVTKVKSCRDGSSGEIFCNISEFGIRD